MTKAEKTQLALKAIDGDDYSRRYLAGYETAESDIRVNGVTWTKTNLKTVQKLGSNTDWLFGYHRAVDALT